jgi:hypothetical protein
VISTLWKSIKPLWLNNNNNNNNKCHGSVVGVFFNVLRCITFNTQVQQCPLYWHCQNNTPSFPQYKNVTKSYDIANCPCTSVGALRRLFYAHENVEIFIFFKWSQTAAIYISLLKIESVQGPRISKGSNCVQGLLDRWIRVRIAKTLCGNYLSFIRHHLCDSMCQTSASKLFFLYNHNL